MTAIGPFELIVLYVVIAVAVIKYRAHMRLGLITTRTASLIVSWSFLVLGAILFVGGHEKIEGAILAGASIIAIAILQSQLPQPPQAPLP
jgi:hypothetical protein